MPLLFKWTKASYSDERGQEYQHVKVNIQVPTYKNDQFPLRPSKK